MMLKETGKPKSKDKDKQKKKVAFTAVEEKSSDCDEEDEGLDVAWILSQLQRRLPGLDETTTGAVSMCTFVPANIVKQRRLPGLDEATTGVSSTVCVLNCLLVLKHTY